MEDQRSPDEDQDITESSSQIGCRQRQFLKDELPADRVETKDQDREAEPGDVAGREKGIFSAELKAGGSQALHKHSDDRQKDDVSSFF